MFDPEGDLARYPRLDEATTVTLALQDMPSELILRIASFLEVRDLLALRRVGSELVEPEPPRAYQVKSDPKIHIQP